MAAMIYYGFGLAPLKNEGEGLGGVPRRQSRDWLPEWLGRYVRDLAGRVYRRFDRYGS